MVLRLDPTDTRSFEPSGKKPQRLHFCVLGGGFGGLYTALALHQRLKSYPTPCRITLVEPHDRFTFTPLLYELLTRELGQQEVAPTYSQLLAKTSVRVQKDWVESINLAHRRVYLRHGEPLTYDYLVVALGSRQRTFATPGVKSHALPFSNLEDARKLEQRLTVLEQSPLPLIQLAVVGGGPSGVELACKLADRLGHRGQIHLLDRRSALLRTYPIPVQKAALKALRSRRIKIHLDAAVDAVEAHQMRYHQGGQQQILNADLVLWAVGASPYHWPSVDGVPATERGQCLVRPTLQLPEYPEVFVLGDMAAMPWADRGYAPLTAQAAFQAAPIVAHNLWAAIANRPLKPFTYHHLGTMLTLGQNNAVVCGFGLTLTGWLGSLVRRWAYWFRMPTWRHRWQVLLHALRGSKGSL
ncbi:NAD(P)/FAD-dependent oxidoreductase [Pseudanabaena sp. FACHB-2040]|uniref:NAD(P)/FAD-dependent oxidoreductase n=1 Tax=Pseudanabaena sp. FACHB-2040 TaxID=2692859 RepID=UPI0016849DA7|nr:NAD(P)/FAD-dependent oxidoreductase [Pseudanabaena sp. FACHB-2040]MBD2258529.1 NAD(P)/FAD-dependent oxidoreductase [Pseudanabaena sp. FACHB-2040]